MYFLKKHVSRVAMTLALSAIFVASNAGGESPPEAFETDIVFEASTILAESPDLLEGPYHRVRERVENDGYWDYYTVDSDFGVYSAHGWLGLRKLVGEIEALAEISEVTQTEVFLKSAADRGLDPVRVATQIVTHPVETITGIPNGIKLMFQRYKYKADKIIAGAKRLRDGEGLRSEEDPRLVAACEQEEEPFPGACDEDGYGDDFGRLSRRYFGVTRTQLEFHEELGTDPYSSNETLQDSVRKLAWLGGVAQYGTRKLNPAGKLQTLNVAGRIYKYAWRMEPFELRAHLAETLMANGVDKQSTEYFLNNPYMTPTKQVFITMAVKSMTGVERRENLIDWAADSRNEDEAVFSMASVALVAWFHGQHKVAAIKPNTLLPVVLTEDGRSVALLPVDYLGWTEEVATILEAARYTEDFEEGAYREIWLLQRASDRAREELSKQGITVIEDGYKELMASGEQLEFDIPDLVPEQPTETILEIDRVK